MAGAPDLSIDDKLPLTVLDFKEQLEGTISKSDYKLLYFLFLKYDCQNLVKMLKDPNAEIDPRGNLSREQLEDLMKSAREMNFNVHRYPAFMSIYARGFDDNIHKEGFYPEDAMAIEYYNYAMTVPDKMMRQWYELNLNMDNVLTALLAKKNGWNPAKFIEGDNFITETIKNSNAPDFGLSSELDYMPQIMNIVACQDPVEKEKRIDAFKWNWLDDMTFFDVFNIDAVFAYILKLDMLERWARLDPVEGQKTFRSIISELRSEAEVPEEFKVKKWSVQRFSKQEEQ